jgi:hypothetical protein
MKVFSVESKLMHVDIQMDGQTDMTKLIGTFCEYEKVPRIHYHTQF